jgi:hypothetical protein
MRKRIYPCLFYLNEKEKEHFDNQVEIAGLNKSQLLRDLVLGANLTPQPSDDYYKVRRLLSNLTNNVNQIALHANAAGYIDLKELQDIKCMINKCWEYLKTLG